LIVFLQVVEKAGQLPPLHPVRAGAALDFNGAAFTGAIDKAAMAASRSNEAFIAMSSQKLGDGKCPSRNVGYHASDTNLGHAGRDRRRHRARDARRPVR
jgi:hypothetical protein